MPCGDNAAFDNLCREMDRRLLLQNRMQYIVDNAGTSILKEIGLTESEYKGNFKYDEDNYQGPKIDMAPYICSALHYLEDNRPELFEKIVYTARDKKSRDLANWWESHLEWDKSQGR